MKEPERPITRIKFFLTIVLAFIVLLGSGILLWQISKQDKHSDNQDFIALQKQIEDLNKKIDDLNKVIEEAKNSSPTVESKTFVKSGSGQVAGARDVNVSGKVNINSASLSQLDSLPGIGSTYAQRIIEYRGSNGGFKSIEDIKNVKGIGDKTFEKFKDLITI